MEKSVERTQRTVIKVAFGSFFGIVLLVAACWGGRDLYVRWQERRLVRQAVYDIQHGDDKGASLAARTLLSINPSSVGASRLVAELTEKANDRSAMDWRRKVAELAPHSTEDQLAWARCALQFKDVSTAEKAIARVEPPGRETAGYHATAGLLAEAKKDDAKADAEWSEAVRLAPGEKGYQLQLGNLRLRSSNEDRHASGRKILEDLRQDPAEQAAATRNLITDGVARKQDAQELLVLARDLQSYPQARLTDKLIYLSILHQMHDPAFFSYVEELQKAADGHPWQIGALLSWMSENNLNLMALDYIKSLPPDMPEKWPLPLNVAIVYEKQKDWRRLENLTQSGNWRQMEFLRHAYLARALRSQDKTVAADREWNAAKKDVSDKSEATLVLMRTVSEWNWKSEAIDLLWDLAKFPDKENEAVASLYKYYAKTDDTQGLYKVLVRLAELDPNNLDVANNLAQIGLLLNARPDDARRIAAENYHKKPTNAAYVATYAYSLLTKGDPRGAVKAMGSLTEEQLKDPAVSAYYGICLAAIRDERAHPFLERGQEATLLPEERALLTRAVNSMK